MFSLKKKEEPVSGKRSFNDLPPLPAEDRIPELPEISRMPEEKPIVPAVQPAVRQGQRTGPMFVSVNKYQDLKSSVYFLKAKAEELRQTIEALKANKQAGSELLKQSTESLQAMEEKMSEISKVVKS